MIILVSGLLKNKSKFNENVENNFVTSPAIRCRTRELYNNNNVVIPKIFLQTLN